MTPEQTPPSREELAEDVAARLRAAGLDAVSDGDGVTVREPAKAFAEDGASTGRNIATVLGATLAAAALALLLSLLWFGVAFSFLGGEASDAGHRAGVIGFTIAALFGGLAALFAGFGARTPTGERDAVALILGILLGTPVLYVMARSLGNTIDALTSVGKTGVVGGLLFFAAVGLLGDRLVRKR